MPLQTGTKLHHYEIERLIATGGMGEVYKARDTRLHRAVAVKVLQAQISDQPEARARFEREAQTIASLNHPHICTLHDVGRHETTDFLVMEFVEGETLAQHLERGPLPVDRALTYAMQILDALDKAHRQGISHRDLKPGNVMISKSGVKVLDFGLAKLSPTSAVSGLSNAATLGSVTAQGTILGTLQYMAPEQLEAGDVDARTDIFAFGALLYEMITGRKAFEGKSAVSVIGAILKDTPKPVSALQPIAPAALDRVVAACLEKDPDDRWQTARDISRELRWIAEPSSLATAAVEARPVRGWSGVPLSAVIVAVALLLITGAVVWIVKPSGANESSMSSLIRLTVEQPQGMAIDLDFPLALSPDGTTLAFAASQAGLPQLYVRSMDSLDAKALPGTDGAHAPFFSPDGKWIGFFSQGKLRKVALSGGAPQPLCGAPLGMGGTWAEDDTIYFSPFNLTGIWKVPASGGSALEVTHVDRGKSEVSHRFPSILPGGTSMLFTVWTGPGWDEHDLQLLDLRTGARHTLIEGADGGRYSPSGHIVYARAGNLMAAPFDLDDLEVMGPGVALSEQVDVGGESTLYALSNSGALAYVPGLAQNDLRRLVWVDRKGNIESIAAPLRPYYEHPDVSPDGQSALVTSTGPIATVLRYEFSRNTLTPLTSQKSSSQYAVWTADGKRMVYRGTRSGFRNLWRKPSDGSGEEERLTTSEHLQTAESVSRDGKWLSYVDVDPVSGADIWVVALEEQREPKAFVNSSASERSGAFSPDSRWLAYQSDQSGRSEIYVQPFPGPGGRVTISSEGGTDPTWSRDGRELFYLNGGKMMAVTITSTNSALVAGRPSVLFDRRFEVPDYDVAPGGRFLRIQPANPDQAPAHINVVLNWTKELTQRVPTTK